MIQLVFDVENNLLILLNDPRSPVSEAYRVLRTNLQFSGVDRRLRRVVFTSAGSSEGKSVSVCNTAITFAQAGSRVLVVDADLRKPKIHKIFNIQNRKGLTNVLALHEDYNDCIVESPTKNLDILTSGAIPPNPSELLSSKAMKELLEKLLEEYEYIFLDSPPICAVTDATILSTIVDGTVLVAASGKVDRDLLRYAKELLEKVGANIVGVVLNRVPRSDKGKYYYYYYRDDSDKTGERKVRKYK